jgi:hypothetical protein
MENGLTPPNIALQLKCEPMLERIYTEIFNDPTIALSLVALAMSFSASVRNEVRKRQGGYCDCCGEKVDKLQIHHRKPTCQHGNNQIENAVGLCQECHHEVDEEALEGVIYSQVHTYARYYPQGNGRET